MDDTYVTTYLSLLYILPHMLRNRIMSDPTQIPSTMITTNATRAAKRAALGFPAPNSFDTLY